MIGLMPQCWEIARTEVGWLRERVEALPAGEAKGRGRASLTHCPLVPTAQGEAASGRIDIYRPRVKRMRRITVNAPVNSSRCGSGLGVRPSAPMMIRDVREGDAAAVAAIYGHHVLHGTAAYDTEPPSVDDTLAKIRRITSPGWPFIIAEQDGAPAGYAYVTQFRDRAAYAWTCETSVYVHPEWQGRGVGKALLRELCDKAEAFGFRQIVGVIGGAEPASIALHASCGFEEVGRLRAAGWKHGRWLDNVYMQRALGMGSSEPPEV